MGKRRCRVAQSLEALGQRRFPCHLSDVGIMNAPLCTCDIYSLTILEPQSPIPLLYTVQMIITCRPISSPTPHSNFRSLAFKFRNKSLSKGPKAGCSGSASPQGSYALLR